MRAFLTGAERIEIIGRASVAYGFMLLLFLFDIIAAPYPLTLLFGVPFTLIALYYWCIYRPSLIPPWLAFSAGLCLDLLSGFPLGLNALLYMLVRMFLVNQGRFLTGQGFMVTWIGFVSLNIALHLTQWAVMSALSLQILSPDGLWAPVLLGSLFFPVISASLHLTHKIL